MTPNNSVSQWPSRDARYIESLSVETMHVFLKHYAPGGNKVHKAIISSKVKVKIIRSLTLMSIERVSLVEYTCQI